MYVIFVNIRHPNTCWASMTGPPTKTPFISGGMVYGCLWRVQFHQTSSFRIQEWYLNIYIYIRLNSLTPCRSYCWWKNPHVEQLLHIEIYLYMNLIYIYIYTLPFLHVKPTKKLIRWTQCRRCVEFLGCQPCINTISISISQYLKDHPPLSNCLGKGSHHPPFRSRSTWSLGDNN